MGSDMATPRLPQPPHERERHIEAFGRSADPYLHETAMDRLLGRDAPAIARAVGLAGRTVNQYREKFDSDHRGPGRLLAQMIREAICLGRPEADALAPIAALADEFQRDLAPRGYAEPDSLTQTTATAAQALERVGSAIAAALVCANGARMDAGAFANFEALHDKAITDLHLLRRVIEARYEAGRFAGVR